MTRDWGNVSLMARLNEKYNWNTIYIEFKFKKNVANMEIGTVEFTTQSIAVSSMTFGGQIIISDQIDGQDLFDLRIVNPFLNLKMNQISFSDLLVQDNQVFLTNFEHGITITPASPATHIPSSIFKYMDNNFFQHLCYPLGESSSLIQAEATSLVTPLKSCICDGSNFYGMP